MRILVSGGSGLVGQDLIATLRCDGHQIVQLVRRRPNPEAPISEIAWDPERQEIDLQSVGQIDVAIHLGGASITGTRWNSKRKLMIYESRVKSTRLLSQELAALEEKPKTLIVASAVGFYGDRGEEPLTEVSSPGKGFLADTAVQWESATNVASEAGIRVVNTRFGLIMSRRGGFLTKVRLPFEIFLGGNLGNGRQWCPWISLSDVVNGLSFVIARKDISGPVNFTAPMPVRNEDFSKMMAKTLSRPAWINVPAPIIRLLFGKMGDETILHSQKAFPEKLQAAGFNWLNEELGDLLNQELTR